MTIRSFGRCLLVFSLFSAASLPAQVTRFTVIQVSDLYEMPGVVCDQSASRVAPPRCQFGGLARLAALVRQERQLGAQQRIPVYTILAGGLISPSALQGAASGNGANMVRLASQDVGGTPLIQFATFGRHEFDLPDDQLQATLDAGGSPQWFSANLLSSDGNMIARQYRRTPQPECQDGAICRLSIETGRNDSGGNPLRLEIGLIGATVNPNKKWVTARPTDREVMNQVAGLRDKVDVLIAVTHQSDDDDRVLGNSPTGATLDLILGGHTRRRTFIPQQGMQDLPGITGASPEGIGTYEKPCHDPQNQPWTTDKFNNDASGRRSWTPPSVQPVSQIICTRDNSTFGPVRRMTHKKRIPPPVFKADANAISAWVHRFEFDFENRVLKVTSQIRELAAALYPPDGDMARVVAAEWERAMTAPLDTMQLGTKLVDLEAPLDATEACLRSGSCKDDSRLASGLARAIHCRTPAADIAIYHAGAVALDGMVAEQASGTSMTPMTMYDLIRVMPFKGQLLTAPVPIEKVYQAIKTSQASCQNLGCYLWFSGARWDPATKTLTIPKKNITYPNGRPNDLLQVTASDYLLTNRLLTNRDEDVIDLTVTALPAPPGQDWRVAISQYFLKPTCETAQAGN